MVGRCNVLFRNGPISGDMFIFGGASVYVDQLSAGFILFGSCVAVRTNNSSIYYTRHILLYMIYRCLPTHISICIMFSLDHRYVFARICAPVYSMNMLKSGLYIYVYVHTDICR